MSAQYDRQSQWKDADSKLSPLKPGRLMVRVKQVVIKDIGAIDFFDQDVIFQTVTGLVILLDESIRGLVSRHNIRPGAVIVLTIEPQNRITHVEWVIKVEPDGKTITVETYDTSIAV